MKTLTVLLLFVFPVSFHHMSLKAQFDDKTYDKEKFLIGTLDDYMGYIRTFNAGTDSFNYQKVDIYTQDELKFALFVDSIFNVGYKDIYLVNNGAPKGIKLYSPSLSEKIDNYFDYIPLGMFTMKGDTTFEGKIRKNILQTEKEKLSFLLGAYIRHGAGSLRHRYFEGNAILMYNSTSKAALCAELLKEFECANVVYDVKKGTIPVGHFISFTPSPKVQTIIDEAERLNNIISKINTDDIEFNPTEKKFIWREPDIPKKSFKDVKTNQLNDTIGEIIIIPFSKQK